jgi:hypothetical protein
MEGVPMAPFTVQLTARSVGRPEQSYTNIIRPWRDTRLMVAQSGHAN